MTDPILELIRRKAALGDEKYSELRDLDLEYAHERAAEVGSIRTRVTELVPHSRDDEGAEANRTGKAGQPRSPHSKGEK